jgi:hypothetical protein
MNENYGVVKTYLIFSILNTAVVLGNFFVNSQMGNWSAVATIAFITHGVFTAFTSFWMWFVNAGAYSGDEEKNSFGQFDGPNESGLNAWMTG